MNTAKDIIKKLVDEIPESKAGEVIDFLLYLKGKKETSLYLDPLKIRTAHRRRNCCDVTQNADRYIAPHSAAGAKWDA